MEWLQETENDVKSRRGESKVRKERERDNISIRAASFSTQLSVFTVLDAL